MTNTPEANRNWTEDFSHENGQYECKCCECGNTFYGHKRRVLCKSCSNLLSPSDTPEASLAVAEACEPFGYLFQPHGATVWDFSKIRPLVDQGAFWTVIPVYTRPTDTSAGERGIVQPSIATKPTSSRTEASATETDDRRTEHLRVQALGAALSRRDWSAAERAYEAIRDAFDMLPANAETDARNRSESTPPAVLAAPQPPVEGLREALDLYGRAADDLRVRESVAWEKLRSERQRQIDVEGWSPAHDDAHENAELMRAGMCYLAEAASTNSHQPHGTPMSWPWEDKWWKPSTPERNLIKAGGLFFAEKERLERANRYSGHVTHKIELVIRRLAALASPSLTAGDQKATSDLDVHADVAEALTQACEYFENRADVNDGDYGVPEPNTEMRLAQMCSDALERLPALDLQGPGKMDLEDRSTHEA